MGLAYRVDDIKSGRYLAWSQQVRFRPEADTPGSGMDGLLETV